MTWRIMVVDDEPDVRTVVSATLKGTYEVVEAFDGLDALEKLDRYEPDFVVIDVMMPLMNGLDACTAIRRHPKFRDIPVMFLTALGEKEAMIKGYKAGATLYLTKPFDSSRLLRNIDVYFEKTPPEPYEKRMTIEQIREREAEQPAEPPFPIDLHEADTLFDFTIPREAIEWRKTHKGAREPVELSETAEPTMDELKALKERWKEETKAKQSGAYSFKPPRGERAKAPAADAASSDIQITTQAAHAYTSQAPREVSKPPIDFSEIERIVPARMPSPEAQQTWMREAGMEHVTIDPGGMPAPPAEEPKPLPLSPPPEPVPPPSATDLRPRIMVIDDDLDIIELCKLTLSDECEVVWATDGLLGIESLVAWEPDILLLDIMVPKVSGFQILQSIRRNQTFRNLIVIMISAKGSQRDQDYAYRLGANSYVVKPFAPSSLHDLVAKYTMRGSFRVREKLQPIEMIRPHLAPLPDEQRIEPFAGEEEGKVLNEQEPESLTAQDSDNARYMRELKSQEEAILHQMEEGQGDVAEPKPKKPRKGFPFFRKG